LKQKHFRNFWASKTTGSSVLGYVCGKPLHVVAAYDEKSSRVFVITAYEPALEIFEADYRTRRTL